jgi:hypothetical protein
MGMLVLRSGGKYWPLESLAPRWLDAPGRTRVGLSFRCPAHGNHRLCLWFENPLDHGPPVDAPRHCWREGEDFQGLTVLGRDDERALAFPGHWRGWLVEGELHPSRFIPAAPDPAVDYGAPPAGHPSKRH